MGVRHSGRELALEALYQIDICGDSAAAEPALLKTPRADEQAGKFASELIRGVQRERALLDRYLADSLEHWSIGRLSRVDHNILRLAIYEFLRMDDIPARVTIDEAIELAKTYGDQDSGRFVNGVLDQVATRLKVKDKGEVRNSLKSGQA